MAQSFTPWMGDQSMLIGQISGGYGPMSPIPRDPLDAARGLYNRDPGAQYPDGYLGTMESNRQADKIVNHVYRSQRAYNRGVHKGERLDQSEYLWPDEFNLMSGVENQRTGKRYVSPAMAEVAELGSLQSQGRLINDGKPGPRDYGAMTDKQRMPVLPDPVRAEALRRMAPSWA